jgi:hypothetical protein
MASMDQYPSTVAIISLIVSIVTAAISVPLSIISYRQARKTGLLEKRHQAIDHVRTAIADVKIHAHIGSETTTSLREAYQIAMLVFSKKVSDTLGELNGISFQLENKPLELKSNKDLDAEQLLGVALEKVLADMQSEAALSKW